jgi:hypothetical protein
VVYIREAHPVGGARKPPPQFQITDPKTLAERQKVAEQFAEQVNLWVPILVDTIDDQVEQTYAGWPDRIYILDAGGKIVHKGEEGPRGFKPSLERAPAILDELLKSGRTKSAPAAKRGKNKKWQPRS